jgi:hypothetical protein
MPYKIIAMTENSAFDLLVKLHGMGSKAIKLENSRCILTDHVFTDTKLKYLVAMTEECNEWDLEVWSGA